MNTNNQARLNPIAQRQAATPFSPMARTTYERGDFERVLVSAEAPTDPPAFSQIRARAAEKPAPKKEAHAAEKLVNEDSGDAVTNACPLIPAANVFTKSGANPGVPQDPPAQTQPISISGSVDVAQLAQRLDQLGIRLDVSGLAVRTPAAAATAGPGFSLPEPKALAEGKSDSGDSAPEVAAAPENSASEGETSNAGTDSDNGSSSPHQAPPEPMIAAEAATDAFGIPASTEIVPGIGAVEAPESAQPVILPDGITVRVADPAGAWEVDVLRSGSELQLVLRGAPEITDSVIRDEATLRHELAREGYHLSHLRIEAPRPGDEIRSAVRGTTRTESSSTTTDMDHDQANARREEAPSWMPPRSVRPSTSPTPTPMIARGHLDREI